MQRIAVIIFLTLGFAKNAHAGMFFDLNTFYFSDTLQTTAATTTGRIFFEAAVGFDIDKKGNYQMGWNYGSYTTTETSTTTTTYASSQMGPKFNFYFGRDRDWSLGASYNLVTTATYTPDGGTAEKWKGTAIKVDAGYNWHLTESFMFGLRLNYSSATYIEKIVSETTYSTIAYTRVHIFPSIYLGAWF